MLNLIEVVTYRHPVSYSVKVFVRVWGFPFSNCPRFHYFIKSDVRGVIRELKKRLHLPRREKAHIAEDVIFTDVEIIQDPLIAFRSRNIGNPELNAVTQYGAVLYGL